jgi:hypothetical protein
MGQQIIKGGCIQYEYGIGYVVITELTISFLMD